MDNAIRIATWRRARGLTLQDIATDLGVTVSAVSLWEAGDVNPSHPHFAKLVTQTLRLTWARFHGPLPKDAHEAALAHEASLAEKRTKNGGKAKRKNKATGTAAA